MKRFQRILHITLLGLAIILTDKSACTAQSENLQKSSSGAFYFPLMHHNGGHMRQLVENCFGYVHPKTGIIDKSTGYPFEGWNQEAENGLFLRSFTQLTAIGSWVELLANIAAGYADNPFISRQDALVRLEHAVKSLREDQRNPQVAAKGLLVNFLDLEGGARKGPLEETVERKKFFDSFGEKTGGMIWEALQAKGWLRSERGGLLGRVIRTGPYGSSNFTGPLAPFASERTITAVMSILDARAVTVVFGDNVNLTAALAKSIGALLSPGIKDNPQAALIRDEMELFIDAQAEGYRSLYDKKSGTLAFGWDAGKKRFLGWDDGAGNWVTGRMNYLINEFRGPWFFSVLRYGLPLESLMNAGFKMKPYHNAEGKVSYGLCAWDGSAFQLLGFNLFMGELRNPAWRSCLDLLVDIELDYSRRNSLAGFLSEAYSGNGVEYTGYIGIPDMAVTNRVLITYAPSLYSLGVGYGIAPDKLEPFIAGNWPVISTLLTDHGPWEGYNIRGKTPVRYQTTTHTLSLILAALGSADGNMRRYLDMKGLSAALAKLYEPGTHVDFMNKRVKPVSWTADGSPVTFKKEGLGCLFEADFKDAGGMVFQVPQERGISISGGMLRLRYRSATTLRSARISCKRTNPSTKALETLPVEIFLELKKTGDNEKIIEICLPAVPALQAVNELALVFGDQGQKTKVAITITGFEFMPL
jgi:hypothetical protein